MANINGRVNILGNNVKDRFNLYEKVNNKIKIGVCVLNVNTRYLGKLLKDILEPLLELKSISLGLGTGDNKYENRDFLYDNNIEDIICYILENKNFINNESQLFLGGNSKEKLDLVKKYNLGINQWMGSDSNFIKKHNINSDSILDDFIEKNPKISKSKRNLSKNNLANERMKKIDFATENLAEIYIKQNKISEAIKIYKKLLSNNSKKKSYFAKKIEKLKS